MFEARFQSFDDRTERGASAPRVAALRAELIRRGLDGFVVPRTDRYQNEYVPPCAERLAFITGFSGSAGLAVVLAERAVLFVDGRYQLQAAEEVDGAIFTIEHLIERPPPAWLEANLRGGQKLGYSPWLHTVDGAERLAKACAAAGASLAVIGDAEEVETLVEPVRDADGLVIEATFLEPDAALARERGHLTAADAGRLAAAAGVGALYLTHISGRYDPAAIAAEAAQHFPDARVVGDFDRITVQPRAALAPKRPAI